MSGRRVAFVLLIALALGAWPASRQALLDAHDREMAPPAWPSLIEGPIPIDHPLGVPDRASDEYVYWDN